MSCALLELSLGLDFSAWYLSDRWVGAWLGWLAPGSKALLFSEGMAKVQAEYGKGGGREDDGGSL